jgi:hypothetical protein
MSNARLRARMKVGDPAEVERFVEETKDAIGDAVMIMDGAEKHMDETRRDYDKAYASALLAAPGPQYQRAAHAVLDENVDKAKDAYDVAKRAFHYAEREARSLEKELFAWQSILNSVRATWNATGGR